MDYSQKNILAMVQDLQRAYLGEITMHVQMYRFEDTILVNACVFDKDDEPHNFNFPDYESDEQRKENYKKVYDLVYETATARRTQ